MKNLSVINGKIVGFENSIYIGRGGRGKKNSPLANPYKIGIHGDRAEVIEKYRYWLWVQIQENNQEVIGELDRILRLVKDKDVQLSCFCKPLPCHGDIIVNCIRWMNNRITPS